MAGEKKGAKKGGARKELVTREYTINLHKRLHGKSFKKKAPLALKEVRPPAGRGLAVGRGRRRSGGWVPEVPVPPRGAGRRPPNSAPLFPCFLFSPPLTTRVFAFFPGPQVKKFAAHAMKTADVRVDVKLNKFLWSRGVRNVSRGVARGGRSLGGKRGRRGRGGGGGCCRTAHRGPCPAPGGLGGPSPS